MINESYAFLISFSNMSKQNVYLDTTRDSILEGHAMCICHIISLFSVIKVNTIFHSHVAYGILFKYRDYYLFSCHIQMNIILRIRNEIKYFVMYKSPLNTWYLSRHRKETYIGWPALNFVSVLKIKIKCRQKK